MKLRHGKCLLSVGISTTLTLCLLPQASSAVVSLVFHGTVEEAYFGADEVFPIGTQANFRVEYDIDIASNPDLNPDPDNGLYRLLLWEFLGFGASRDGEFSAITVMNATSDSLSFEAGSTSLPGVTIPSRGPAEFSFNSGSLRFHDPTGTAIDSDELPTDVAPSTWADRSFLLRWGGADGPAIRGNLQAVPEPSAECLMLLSALVLSQHRNRKRDRPSRRESE